MDLLRIYERFGLNERQIEIVGNQLTWTSAPFKSPQTGQDMVFVVTFEREGAL